MCYRAGVEPALAALAAAAAVATAAVSTAAEPGCLAGPRIQRLGLSGKHVCWGFGGLSCMLFPRWDRNYLAGSKPQPTHKHQTCPISFASARSISTSMHKQRPSSESSCNTSRQPRIPEFEFKGRHVRFRTHMYRRSSAYRSNTHDASTVFLEARSFRRLPKHGCHWQALYFRLLQVPIFVLCGKLVWNHDPAALAAGPEAAIYWGLATRKFQLSGPTPAK